MPLYWLHCPGSARVCWACTELRVCPAVSWRSSTPLRLSGPGTQPPLKLVECGTQTSQVLKKSLLVLSCQQCVTKFQLGEVLRAFSYEVDILGRLDWLLRGLMQQCEPLGLHQLHLPLSSGPVRVKACLAAWAAHCPGRTTNPHMQSPCASLSILSKLGFTLLT